MYVLDTDTFSRFTEGHAHIVKRVLDVPSQHLWISAVNVEELLVGQLRSINTSRGRHPVVSLPEAYDFLVAALRDIQNINILPYTVDAEVIYLKIPSNLRKLHPQDCRIAAAAMAADFTVVTCNTDHFQKIPDLKWEDWSR